MNKIIILLLIFSSFIISCSENEKMIYKEKPALYFSDNTALDSLNFSFTMTQNAEEALQLSVKLLGNTLQEDKIFMLQVDPSSTAVEGTHYKSLEAHYVFPENSTEINIPITVMKSQDLDEKMVSLNISIIENENFDVGYSIRSMMQIRLTNQLIKPTYWNMPLALYFGDYSKVKHQKSIDIMGHDFPLVFDDNYNYYMLIGRSVAMYFALNPTLDENGILIEPWATF